MQLTPEQDKALQQVVTWLDTKEPVFRLFGFAGTGKTTLAQYIASLVKGRVVFGAFTGKAALVMRNKGCEDASTIHSMIYRAIKDHDGHVTFTLNRENSTVIGAKLVIIDECSMVDRKLGSDLRSLARKILVLGDPMQLPPISGAGFFTSEKPHAMLTDVHRQAANNPIVKMATDVRAGKPLPIGHYGTSRVLHAKNINIDDLMKADQILVGKNQTRHRFNRRMRELLGRLSPLPEVNEKLVCLRNRAEKGLFNGGLYSVMRAKELGDKISMDVAPEFETKRQIAINVHRDFFLKEEPDDVSKNNRADQFNYGYALTVHKAQGSQWNDVVIFDESDTFPDDIRKNLLYTAITRAAERVTLVKMR
jgi:exodeoxyribonuclease-5